MSDVDQNVASDDVTATTVSQAAADDVVDDDDGEGVSVDADNDDLSDSVSDDDHGVEVIGENQDYYDDDDNDMTAEQPTSGDDSFTVIYTDNTS